VQVVATVVVVVVVVGDRELELLSCKEEPQE